MFDAVVSSSPARRSNAAGAALSLLVCAAIAAAATVFLKVRRAPPPPPVDVTLVTARPPPPPPPPPPGGERAQPREKKPVVHKRDVLVQPKVETREEPKPVEQPEESGVPGGEPGGVPGGVVGGVQGGVPGGKVGGVVGGNPNSAIPFGLGMTRPQQLSGGTPQYSREATAARVEGKVIVRCVITVDGEVRDCKIIKGVPILQDIVLETLRQSRYTPVTYQGHSEAVQYLFTFNFKLP
jgi:periplasmic protein TonB